MVNQFKVYTATWISLVHEQMTKTKQNIIYLAQK